MSSLFIYSHKKGNITYYTVNPEYTVKVPAINPSNGSIDYKKVIGYTYHENLEMYYITSKYFRPFWASSDHSLIVFNKGKNKIEKVSPKTLVDTNNKSNYSLLKLKNQKFKQNQIGHFTDNCEFIDLDQVIIKYDPKVTTAGDFTVEDYYTFTVSDGVFVQDTIALYRPITKSTEEECEAKLFTIKNLLSPANTELQFKPKQAIVYGIYQLSKTEKGRKLLEKVLGVEIKETLTSKQLNKILSQIINDNNYEILDNIKEIGFTVTSNSCVTLSLLDLEEPNLQLTGDKQKDSEILQEMTENIKQTFPKADIINSGARATWDQVRQMVGSRGYVSDFWGNIVPIAIKNSYSKGLSPYGYFISCYGTRKALLDVAENTAKSGYLTRKMVYGCISCELDYNNSNCNTEYTAKIDVKDEDLAKALIGRYQVDKDTGELLLITNPKDIYGETIYLRSPIFCQSKKLCKTCYGKLSNVSKSRYVGVIAAQTLGERSTQLVLRTFHTGGVAQGKNLDKQEDIVSSFNDVNSIDKVIDIETYQDAVDYTLKLWELFKPYGLLHLVHFEIITSQRLWAQLPDGRMVKVRTHLKELEKYEKYDTNGNIIQMDYKLKLQSIHTIPALESFFLGMAFQNVRNNFIKGFIYPTTSQSILEKIILYTI